MHLLRSGLRNLPALLLQLTTVAHKITKPQVRLNDTTGEMQRIMQRKIEKRQREARETKHVYSFACISSREPSTGITRINRITRRSRVRSRAKKNDDSPGIPRKISAAFWQPLPSSSSSSIGPEESNNPSKNPEEESPLCRLTSRIIGRVFTSRGIGVDLILAAYLSSKFIRDLWRFSPNFHVPAGGNSFPPLCPSIVEIIYRHVLIYLRACIHINLHV